MRTRTLIFVLGIAMFSPAQDDATARQVLERAAYAEEHERDFEKAEKLYREAGSKALFLGDQPLADEALKAVKRLEARAGRGAETQPVAQEAPPAVQRRLYLLVKQLSAPVTGEGTEQSTQRVNYDAMNQIIPFGAAAVPMLEKALNAEVIVDPEQTALQKANQGEGASSFRGDSKWAARTLGMIKGPEAAAALRRGIESPDPVVKSAVLMHTLNEHRAIFETALKDASPAVVALAISRLSQIDDPALADVMKAALQRDDHAAEAAAAWFVNHKPEEALAMMKDPKGSAPRGTFPYVLDRSVYVLAKQFWKTALPQVQKLATLIEVAEAASEPEQVARILTIPDQQAPWNSLSDDLKQRGETAALRALTAGEIELQPDFDHRVGSWHSILNALAGLGSIRSAEAYLRLIEIGRVHDNGNRSYVFRVIAERAGPSELMALVQLASRYAVALPNESDEILGSIVSGARKAEPKDVVAALGLLPDALRVPFIKSAVQFDRVPVEIARAALELGEPQIRGVALSKLASAADPATLPDAVRAIGGRDSQVQVEGGNLFAQIARVDPTAAMAELDKQLTELEPDPMQHLASAANVLPRAEVVAALDRAWAAVPPERRTGLTHLALQLGTDASGVPEANAFLVRHFHEISDGHHRGEAVDLFRQALYQPALELIGKALTDPSPNVREKARQALTAFREHREALEEFKRWQTGDAESRASIAELVKLLESTSPDVVAGAAKALGAIKAKSALPALVKLLARPEPEVKKAVQDAIAKIGE